MIRCDIRIAGESGKLAPAFTKRGVLPESGGTWLLPRLVGYAKAAEIAFTGRTLSAKECLDLGLVNRVVGDAEVAEVVAQLDARVAQVDLS
jgi:enoyl-CoA hydratase/carnithine racemase